MTASQAGSADPSRPIHIVFVGAGAVGGFYASRLHHPSHNIHVSLIARSNYAPLAKEGMHLETRSFGNYTFHPHAVFPSVAAASTAPASNPLDGSSSSSPAAAAAAAPPSTGWDFIVVTTKALPDRGDDSATIAPLVGPGSAIVLIQNGVGVEDPYRRRFPGTPIVSAVTVISAEQIRPGTIRQNRWTRVHLGPYTDSASLSDSDSDGDGDGGSSKKEGSRRQSPYDDARAALSERGARATADLAGWLAGLGGVKDAEALTELGLQTVRWHKLCINAAFNPSAVLSGGRGNADMLTDPELRAHLRGVMDEVWAAAPTVLGRSFEDAGRVEGHGYATPERIIRSTERNAGARPSMLLDWEAGRPLEIEVILGNPVRIARAKGVEMRRLQSMYGLLRSAQSVREREKKEKGKGKGKL